jgi:hypothetical protein
MAINAVSGSTSVASILPSYDKDADDIQSTGGVLPSATQTTVSPEGGLFGQLSQLSQSNPDEFKQVAAEISQKLKDEAGQATGDKATFLNNLADKFNQAAQSGDMSSLKPSSSHGHHKHGHHHGGAGASGQGGQDSLSQIIQQALTDVTGSSRSASTSSAATPTASGTSPAAS